MENSFEEKHRDKNGWAMDADPKNDPTYPMKKRTNEEHKGYTWERPTQQFVDIEVLHSNERPNITAVFGTSTPPSGLSGIIRRYAFIFIENHYGHWLPLILADRINVMEGIVDDLKRGHIPNVFAERGWNAEWKYNRKAAVTKIAVGLALTALIVLKISKKSNK
jgi:hypothetical protein